MLESPDMQAIIPTLTAREAEVYRDLLTRERRNRSSVKPGHHRLPSSDEHLQLAVQDENLTAAPPMESVPCSQQVFHCQLCGVSLNGHSQYEDHLVGKKHKKHEEAALAFHSPASGSLPPVSQSLPPVRPLEVHALAPVPLHDFDCERDDPSRASGWTPQHAPSYTLSLRHRDERLHVSHSWLDSDQRSIAASDLVKHVKLVDDVGVLLELQKTVSARLAALRPPSDAERWLADGAKSPSMGSRQ